MCPEDNTFSKILYHDKPPDVMMGVSVVEAVNPYNHVDKIGGTQIDKLGGMQIEGAAWYDFHSHGTFLLKLATSVHDWLVGPRGDHPLSP